MEKSHKVYVYILLILLIFSNFSIFADASSSMLEAKNNSEFKKIITSEIISKNDKIYIKYYGKAADIENLINDIIDRNAYVRSTIKEIEYSYIDYSNYVELNFSAKYVNTKIEDKLASDEIDKILNNIITDDMYTHEKVKAINDYIVRSGQYDTSLQNYSHYNLLFEGKSVCNGYTLLTYNMLKKLNIPVLIVPGMANNGKTTQNHVWNLVNIGGYWFNLDTTWNDPVPDKGDEVSYDYYLLSDEQISKNHTADSKITYPKAFKIYDEYLKEFNNAKLSFITEPTTNGINIKIRDSYIDFTKYDKTPVEPFIENSRTLVPLRAVFNELGFDVDWDNNSGTATVTDGTKILKIRPNDMYATINGIKKALDVPAKTVNGRIMVPVRFISEAFDNTVFWDNEKQTVIIY